MEEITRVLQECDTNGSPCVLATIVDVNGSAYRREGARCVILEHGEVRGLLSGGCIEEDLKGHAAEVFTTGTPRRVAYDFRAGEDDVWGLGVGCNGAVDIWLELYDPARFPEEAERLAADYRRRQASRFPYEAVTVLASSDSSAHPAGERWTAFEPLSAAAVPGASANFATSEAPAAPAAYAGKLRPGQKAGLVKTIIDGVVLELLVERIRPVSELVIVGVGEDARVLAGLAKQLGWKVSLLYHLTEKATRDHFPGADDVHIIPRLGFDQADVTGKFVVVMSHNLELDREAVRQLIKGEPAYLGLVGSKYRLEQILNYVGLEEPDFDPGLLDKLYSPAGLDIGAETPEEIALSILAEAAACRSGKAGGFLRDRKGLGSGGVSVPGTGLHEGRRQEHSHV